MVRISMLSDVLSSRYCTQKDVSFAACPHDEHSKATGKDEDVTKYCCDKLWFDLCSVNYMMSFVHNLAMDRHTEEKSRQKPSGHTFKCEHPFSEAHVIFICDISGSMSSTDGGKSHAKYHWIKNVGGLDNRLGALYASIHDFVKIRWDKGMLISNILLIAMFAIRDYDSSLPFKLLTIGLLQNHFVTSYTPVGPAINAMQCSGKDWSHRHLAVNIPFRSNQQYAL